METLCEPIEVHPRFIKHLETVIIPAYEKTRDQLVDLLIQMIEDPIQQEIIQSKPSTSILENT